VNINIKKKISLVNFTDKNDIKRIKYIVIHYFGGLTTAENISDYWYDTYAGQSAHYAVDEKGIIQIVEDEDISWHCGGGGVGTLKGICTNSNSIGIEVRPNKIDKSTAKDASKKDWYFEEATMKNLVELTIYLMKKYNIDINHVVRHFDISAKWCPRPFMGDDTNTYYNKSGNQMWSEFKVKLINIPESDDEDLNIDKLTEDQISQLWAKLLKPLQDNDSSTWSEVSRQWAIQNGIFKGDGTGNYQWETPMTREMMAVLLHNFAKFLGKA
jgi:hypothetical protein